jgi:guanylate kinase
MSNKEHTLICVMAESSAGKDSLVSKICELTGWTQLISYSTRPRRENEGNTHVFVEESDYEAMREAGEVAAYTKINGYHYWSTVNQLYEHDFYLIDPIGVKTLKDLNLPNLRIITVYINVPEDVRKERAKSRGDNMDVYRSRSLSEREQFRNMKRNCEFDYAIPNNDFATAVSVLKWICNAEGVWKNHVAEEDEHENFV